MKIKEDEITKYCEDFCPIYDSIKEYNESNLHKIFCNTEFCKHITETYNLNRKEGTP